MFLPVEQYRPAKIPGLYKSPLPSAARLAALPQEAHHKSALKLLGFFAALLVGASVVLGLVPWLRAGVAAAAP